MLIIPAIDVKNGKCVRLLQGRKEDETVFSHRPADMARKWAGMGAKLIHVVDLDGAFEKRPRNREAIRAILAAVSVPVQLGGGIRKLDTLAGYIDLGVERVVIGTQAIEDPAFLAQAAKKYPGRIVVGIDARNGYVAVDGWTRTTETRAVDVAKRLEGLGVAAINFTDIHRDGMQTGPNIEQTRALARAVNMDVVASGGVATIADIQNLLPLAKDGVTGVITGKALYSGSLDLKEALAVAQTAGVF